MLEPLSLQLPLPRVHGILLGVVVEVLQLEGAVLGQLLGVMLNLVPGNDQITSLTIKSKPFLQLFFQLFAVLRCSNLGYHPLH